MSEKLLSIEGFYDGKNIIPLERINVKNKRRIIITFLEKIEEKDDFKNLKLHSEKVFNKLWKDENENIWASYL
ncbi:hypothetical protein H8E88_13630 [candidate division KSB1 bacterium]|nr:hypothetical protein [candidate division KSB1 bacterium]